MKSHNRYVNAFCALMVMGLMLWDNWHGRPVSNVNHVNYRTNGFVILTPVSMDGIKRSTNRDVTNFGTNCFTNCWVILVPRTNQTNVRYIVRPHPWQ